VAVQTLAWLTVMKNRVRELRTERGWTQADLAKRLDVSRNSVIAIENGKYDPSLPLAFLIADAFGMKIEQIFQRD
jgi:putative transcriptional regulator